MRDNLGNRGDTAHSLLHKPCSSVSETCLVADELRGRVLSVRKLGRLRAVLVRPLAASLASPSTFSLPSVPLCPLTHPISSLKAGSHARSQMESTCQVISSIRYCEGQGPRSKRAPRTAWLSNWMMARFASRSKCSICRARMTPTASASNTVWSVRGLRWNLKTRGPCPSLYITATAPTLPSSPEPSEKRRIQLWSPRRASSTSSDGLDRQIFALSSCAGAGQTGVIHSIPSGGVPSSSASSCNGDL